MGSENSVMGAVKKVTDFPIIKKAFLKHVMVCFMSVLRHRLSEICVEEANTEFISNLLEVSRKMLAFK